MNRPEYYHEGHEATYCPEDNKLRLYVGRVPRDQYDALRAEGWTSTPKQDCDFVAHWTPEREDTALSFAGYIGDEDTPPTERAADRAERFGGYRDRRTTEATGHSDRAETVHGFQSQEKAERAAKRAERQAGHAVTQWSKAEYWTSRTAGVISHALHVSSPAVRMGRIKTLEADLRKAEKEWTESTQRAQARFDSVLSVVEVAEGTREKPLAASASIMVSYHYIISRIKGESEETTTPEQTARAVIAAALGDYRNGERGQRLAREAEEGTRPALEIAREWLEGKTRPADWNPEEGSRYTRHLKLRLAYEMQMLEAQGGRAALVEMVPGGFLGSHQIVKVNKSNATGRVVSVGIMYPTRGRNKWGNEDPTAPEFRLEIVNIERMKSETYRAPTPEELEAFHASQKAAKAARPKSTAPALVNPTREDAQRLQDCMNQIAMRCGWNQRNRSEPATICEMTQEEYSARSKGSYARAEATEFCACGETKSGSSWSSEGRAHNARVGPVVCKVRTADSAGFSARRVVVITDKPQKPLPAEMWAPNTETATA